MAKALTDEQKSNKTLNSKIGDIQTRSSKLATDIHDTAVMALIHAETYGDARPMDRLINALHTANRPVALKTWVTMFSPIRWNGDGDVGLLKPTNKAYTPFNIDLAQATPYYSAEEAPKVKKLTLDDLIKIVNDMGKKIDKAEEGDKNMVIAEGQDVQKMRALVARLTAAIGEPTVAAARSDAVTVETLAGPMEVAPTTAVLHKRGLAAPKAA